MTDLGNVVLEARAWARAVVLVEGTSDRLAVETLAARRGRDLAAEGVVVVPAGGAHAMGGFLEQLGPHGRGARLAGLCDARVLSSPLRSSRTQPGSTKEEAR